MLHCRRLRVGERRQRPATAQLRLRTREHAGDLSLWGGWPLYGAGDASSDSAAARARRYSVRVRRAPAAGGEEWGALGLFIPPLAAQRKTLMLTAWVQSHRPRAPVVRIVGEWTRVSRRQRHRRHHRPRDLGETDTSCARGHGRLCRRDQARQLGRGPSPMIVKAAA